MKQTLLNDDAGGGHLDNRQRGRVRIINTGGSGGCGGGGGGGGGDGCTGGWRGAGATHGTGVAEALGAVVLLRAVEEAQVELTAGVERHFRREGVRRRGAAQTRAQRLIEFENVHCTGIERTYERSRRRVGGAGGEQRGARRVSWRSYRPRHSAFERASCGRALSRLPRNLDLSIFRPDYSANSSDFCTGGRARTPFEFPKSSPSAAAPASTTELRAGRTFLTIIRWRALFLISSFNYSTLDARCITKLVHLTSLG